MYFPYLKTSPDFPCLFLDHLSMNEFYSWLKKYLTGYLLSDINLYLKEIFIARSYLNRSLFLLECKLLGRVQAVCFHLCFPKCKSRCLVYIWHSLDKLVELMYLCVHNRDDFEVDSWYTPSEGGLPTQRPISSVQALLAAVFSVAAYRRSTFVALCS